MLIRESVSGYRHIDVGNIKLAFTMVCREELFEGVYFAANSLYHVRRGTAILRCGGEEVIVKEGEVALIGQHALLDVRKIGGTGEDGDFRSIIFFLLPDFVDDFLGGRMFDAGTGGNDRSIIRLDDRRSFGAFCESLLPLFDDPRIDRQAVRSKTFEALRLLAGHDAGFLEFLARNSKPVKIDLYEFMLHNAISNYSVADLARLSGRSLSGFKRDFKAIFHTSPHQWILRQKIDYAERLLRESRMKATEIFHLLGFQELSHFSAAFKKLKGVSPTRI